MVEMVYISWKMNGATLCIGLSWLRKLSHLSGVAPPIFAMVYFFCLLRN